MKNPHTWFSTEFRGGSRAVRRRLLNLWCHKKGRWNAILVTVCVCVTALAGLLVSCGTKQAPADALARAAIDAGREDWAELEGTWTYLLQGEGEGPRAYALSYDSGIHPGGYGNLLFFAGDPETGELTGSPLVYGGDENDLTSWTAEDGLHVLFTTVTTYQGYQNAQGGHLRFADGAWTLLWPLDQDTEGLDYDDYWADRKGVLTPGGMDLYTRGDWTPGLSDLPQWTYERTFLLEATEHSAPLAAARRFVAGVVPDQVRGNAEFQITGFQPAASFPAQADRTLDVDTVNAHALSYRYKEVGQDWSAAVEGPKGLYLFCAVTGPSEDSSRWFADLLGASVLPNASEDDLQTAAGRLEATHDASAQWNTAPGDTLPYAQADVEAAFAAAQAYFDGQPNSQLDRLWFDPASLDFERQIYLRSGGGSVNGVAESNVMILLCDWTWLGPDGPVDHGDQRTDWQLVFIREDPDSPWVLDDQGY